MHHISKLFLLPLLLLMLAAQAKADAVSVADIEVNAGGSSDIVINLETTATTLTGYQMSLYLPEGVTLQKDEDDDYAYTLSSRHNKNHVFSVNEQADGGLLLVCYSPTKKTIAAGSGELLRLPVTVAATATGTLQAQLKTIKLSDTSSSVTQLSDVTFSIRMPQPAVDDAVTVAPIEVKAGESGEMIVSLSTAKTTLTGYQMSVYLPEGVTLQKDEDGDYAYTLSSRHNKNHVFSVNEQADGGLLLVCYSPTKKTIAAGSGELLRLPVTVAATATGTLQGQLKTIKLSDTNSSVTQLSDVAFSITVQASDTPVTPDPPAAATLLYPAEFSIHQGESATMSIRLDNEQDIIMAEFYMQLPEGISIATDDDGYLDATLSADRTDRTHSLEVEQGSDGLYHFLAFSSKNKAFTGNEGELISVTLNCNETVAAGMYQGMLTNILLSDANKQAIELANHPFDIEVVDYILGDVNDDRRINGMDIVEMVDLIMSQGYAKAADLYPAGQPDGKVNGMDLVEEVELVMSQTATATSRLMAASGALQQGLALKGTADGGYELAVSTARRFVLAQLTVQLSAGMTLSDIETDGQHVAACRDMGDGRYSCVVYSTRNSAFGDNQQLLTLRLTGPGEAVVSDVLLVDDARQAHYFAAVATGEATGIGLTENESAGKEDAAYDLQGRKVSPLLKKGVYVINGKKKIVK